MGTDETVETACLCAPVARAPVHRGRARARDVLCHGIESAAAALGTMQ